MKVLHTPQRSKTKLISINFVGYFITYYTETISNNVVKKNIPAMLDWYNHNHSSAAWNHEMLVVPAGDIDGSSDFSGCKPVSWADDNGAAMSRSYPQKQWSLQTMWNMEKIDTSLDCFFFFKRAICDASPMPNRAHT